MDDELVIEPLSDIVDQRNNLWAVKPQWLYPYWFGRCTVRVVLVTDGGLDFGSADFGLRAFIKSIQAAPFYVTYKVTLAHRRFRAGDAMLDGDATIARRITNFRFDNATHFAPDMYDEAWLFGIETGPGIDATELRSISDFMNGGGGVFATGDHGALGKAMGGEIPRVRSMRLWDHTSANSDLDEVSMMERRRNDTNRPGHVTSREFDDQSDDVPQPISPKLYLQSQNKHDVGSRTRVRCRLCRASGSGSAPSTPTTTWNWQPFEKRPAGSRLLRRPHSKPCETSATRDRPRFSSTSLPTKRTHPSTGARPVAASPPTERASDADDQAEAFTLPRTAPASPLVREDQATALMNLAESAARAERAQKLRTACGA